MSSLSEFKAIYCSGIFIPDDSTVTALSLLFEKVYLPRNLELITEFAKKYEFVGPTAEQFYRNFFEEKWPGKLENLFMTFGDEIDLFNHLTDGQKQTAFTYLFRAIQFALINKNLFPEVFETQFYKGSDISKESQPDEKLFKLTVTMMVEVADEKNEFSRLTSAGYIPVVDNVWEDPINFQKIDEMSAKQLASLLGMKSIEIIFPKTRGVHPEIILEARDRLSDHLPPFWSAMLKLSVEMRRRIKECKSMEEVLRESQYLVDTLVMPALIDLQQKMIREKKDWFYKILSPIQKGLRVMIGNPPLTQQQLLTNALVLGSDVMMSAAESKRTIESLKQEAGLTFLLEAEKILSKDDRHDES